MTRMFGLSVFARRPSSGLAVFHDHALRLVALVLAVVCHQTNGPALNTMLAMARTPIASSNRATISVSETGNGLSA
jgi:hypothetical protein